MGHTATVEMCRPPHNFFDIQLISGLADAFETLQADPQCRAVVLAAQGRSFCAGADFPGPGRAEGARRNPGELYRQAVRLFEVTKPVIAAVQGPAIGGGLGLALAADFRVTCPEARFSANFARLGFHPGFALSFTLPRLIGAQKAALLLYTGRRINGEEAVRIGLADELTSQDTVRARAQALADEIALSAPIAVESTRATLRAGLVDAVRAAVEREASEQALHFQTSDFREGIAATAQRRDPVFQRL
jgi:enoyl-CoA hydratase/carnithine racemase